MTASRVYTGIIRPVRFGSSLGAHRRITALKTAVSFVYSSLDIVDSAYRNSHLQLVPATPRWRFARDCRQRKEPDPATLETVRNRLRLAYMPKTPHRYASSFRRLRRGFSAVFLNIRAHQLCRGGKGKKKRCVHLVEPDSTECVLDSADILCSRFYDTSSVVGHGPPQGHRHLTDIEEEQPPAAWCCRHLLPEHAGFQRSSDLLHPAFRSSPALARPGSRRRRTGRQHRRGRCTRPELPA